MADSLSRPLTQRERDILLGFSDIRYLEPDQIVPAEPLYKEEEKKSPAEKFIPIRNKAVTLSERIKALKTKVDKRCSHLIAVTGKEEGSPLFQAMWRLFQKETTDITYEDYKQAITLRQQLAEEDLAEREKAERARRIQDGAKLGNIYPVGKT